MPCARARAHGKGAISLPCALPWHTAKVPLFAVCHVVTAHGKRPFQRVPSIVLYFAVGPENHSAKCLPCAQNVAHDKQALCRPLYAVSCLPCVILGKYFAECKPAFAVCLWHTANTHSPVVFLCLRVACWTSSSAPALAESSSADSCPPEAH